MMQAAGSQGSTGRGSSATVEMGGRRGSPPTVDQSAKKPRLEGEEPLHGPVKREIVAAEHGPRMEVAVKLDVTVLHCPICLRPFRPPVFQCGRGHLACGGCLAGACGRCGDGNAFDVPNTAMDDVVSAARIGCPHDGCEEYVPYHEIQDHESACPHAPCSCTEDPWCGFVGPAPALVAHLAAVHAMPVHKVTYGKVHHIQVTAPEPARRLLVAAGDDGGGDAFLLRLGTLGIATVVTAVCIRAEACTSPSYSVKMWVNGPRLAAPAPSHKTDMMLTDFEATSSTAPGDVAFEDLTSYLMVPPGYLVEGAGPAKELPLHVRIGRTTT